MLKTLLSFCNLKKRVTSIKIGIVWMTIDVAVKSIFRVGKLNNYLKNLMIINNNNTL